MRKDRGASQEEIELTNWTVSPISCSDDGGDDEEEEEEDPIKEEEEEEEEGEEEPVRLARFRSVPLLSLPQIPSRRQQGRCGLHVSPRAWNDSGPDWRGVSCRLIAVRNWRRCHPGQERRRG